MRNTSAVIVTYYPELAPLGRLIASLTTQCSYIVVVDNSEDDFQGIESCFQAHPSINLVSLKCNSGVAKAQNIGIELSLEKGVDAICFFDQDSMIADGFIAGLWSTHAAVSSKQTTRIAAIGPNYTNANNKISSPFVKIKCLSIKRVACDNGAEFVSVDCLISSGSILFADALRIVGFMQEGLFIDYVDTEWCLRAKQFEFACFGACRVHMKHSIGDGSVRFFGRNFSIHSPLRHYYLMRNATHLYLYSRLPCQWKIADGLRLILKFFIYLLVGKPRIEHFQMMTRGIWHGIIGRQGKF